MKTLTIGDLKPRFPIIQGGMGVGISLSGLASAVANEGGIGVISAAGLGLLYKSYHPITQKQAIWAWPKKSVKPVKRQKVSSV